jgi:uncharacterized protein DUF6812
MIVTSVAGLGSPDAPGGETIAERRAKIPGVDSPQPERQLEPIVLETSRYRVEGKVMLPPTGYHSRLSDHLNNPEREFLIVLDATLTPLDAGRDARTTRVVMIHRDRIDLVIPSNGPGAVP